MHKHKRNQAYGFVKVARGGIVRNVGRGSIFTKRKKR